MRIIWSDAAILEKLDEIEHLILAQQSQINTRFDGVDRKLNQILRKLEGNDYVTAELESAVKSVSARAISIDEKVSDI